MLYYLFCSLVFLVFEESIFKSRTYKIVVFIKFMAENTKIAVTKIWLPNELPCIFFNKLGILFRT